MCKDQKYNQEKWVANRTEHIREATARGLEPELRRLMTQHQIELQSLRALHQDELMRSEQQHMTKTAQQLNALRERLDAERDDAVAKERDAMRAKYDKQIDDVEALHAAKFQRFQVRSILLLLLLLLLLFQSLNFPIGAIIEYY